MNPTTTFPKLSIAVLAVAVLSAFAPTAGAGRIMSMNSNGGVLGAGRVGAGVYRAPNWNSADQGFAGLQTAGNITFNPRDNTGAATGMGVSWSANAFAPGFNNVCCGEDSTMMWWAWIDNGGSPSTVTITNIPYAVYDVVTYQISNHDQRGAAVGVSGSASGAHPTTFFGKPRNAGFTTSLYYRATATTAAEAAADLFGRNYTVHTGISGSTATIDWRPTGLGSFPEGWVSGFQIAENLPPIADASEGYFLPYALGLGSVTLDGSYSTDDFDAPLAYSWDIDGDNVFGDLTGASPVIYYTDIESLGLKAGTNTIGLIVSDGSQNSLPSFTTLNVEPVAEPSALVLVALGAASLGVASRRRTDGERSLRRRRATWK